MLDRLFKIKNLITHAITSLQSQQPKPPYDPDLSTKLHFYTNHIMSQEVELQFKAYHQLQNPQISLNEILEQLYYAKQADTPSIVAILGFYTFILNNCQNQLILCKIVSSTFVINLTKVYSNKLCQQTVAYDNPLLDIEQINSYKIALVKAYISKINSQTIKYMILGERMLILQNCISCLMMYILQEKGQFGIEATCMSNSILLILTFIQNQQQYYPACFQQGQNGIYYLLQKIIKQIHCNMLQILKDEQKFKSKIQDITSKIMFIIDLLEHIKSETYRTKIIQTTRQQLQSLKILYKSLMQYFNNSNKCNKKVQYKRVVQLIKILMKLLTLYFSTEQVKQTFQSTISIILDEFIYFLKGCIDNVLAKIGKQEMQEVDDRVMGIEGELKQLMAIFCSNSEILMMMVSHCSYFLRRKDLTKQQLCFNISLINKITQIIQTILNDKLQYLLHYLCYKSLKLLLLSFMHLTCQHNFNFHHYTILKLHQYSINNLQTLLKRNEVWDYIVENYQSLVKMVCYNLVKINCIQVNQYQYCQFHDLYKNKKCNNIQYVTDAIMIDQCIRNFRFMIVEKTYLPIKHIKLEKHYHTHFITPGWAYQPGTLLNQSENSVQFIFQLIHLSNGVKIPISIIKDEQCLIFVHYEEGKYTKIILNIRYKMIEGIKIDKEQLRIRLKGAQQIITEGKQHLQKFKLYLIERRDRTRQRQLKFIHENLSLYFNDNEKVIQEISKGQLQQIIQREDKDEKEQLVNAIFCDKQMQQNIL